MGKLEKYTSYKDSKVDWIGEIPKHWTITKLKYLGTSTIGLTYSPNDLCNNDEGTLVLRSSNIQNGKLTFNDNVYVKSNIPKKLYIKENDILICSRNGSRELIGKCAIAKKEDEIYSFGAFTTVFRSKLNSYLFQILNSEIFKKQSGKFLTSTINQLTVGNLNSFEIPLPPKEEQTKIASFLDDKTAQIDEVISQKEKLIELLKERKQIVINDAVTKGVFGGGTSVPLNSKNEESGAKAPPPEFIDSGIEWIGQIPKHWEIRRFKNYFKFDKGLTITKENLQDDGIFCVNYGEIHSKFGFEVNPKIDNLKCVSEEYLNNNQKSLVNSGDFIFADTSEDIEGSGNFTYLNSDLITFAGYHTIICRPKNDLISRFLAYEFESITFRSQIQKRVKGVKVYSITQGLLKNLIIWLPPKEEQIKIVEYIDSQISKIDKAIELEQNYIEKLKEYKATLIDSVVTGKVRVV